VVVQLATELVRQQRQQHISAFWGRKHRHSTNGRASCGTASHSAALCLSPKLPLTAQQNAGPPGITWF
jgi:hypothetical protein